MEEAGNDASGLAWTSMHDRLLSGHSLWSLVLYKVSTSPQRLQALVTELTDALEQFSTIFHETCQTAENSSPQEHKADGLAVPNKLICKLLDLPHSTPFIYVHDHSSFNQIFHRFDVPLIKEEEPYQLPHVKVEVTEDDTEASGKASRSYQAER